MKRQCCEAMGYHTANHCTVHASPFACPDRLIWHDEESGDYGIIVHDGGESFVRIRFCPWCGSELTPQESGGEKE